MNSTLPLFAETVVTPSESARVAPVPTVRASHVRLSLGGQRVLERIDLSIKPGKLVLIVGDNGSGKTTLLNVLSGFLKPDEGRVTYHLNDVLLGSNLTPEGVARLGIGRLWQDVRLFRNMSVMDNVLVATRDQLGINPLAAFLAWPAVRRQERAARESAAKWLRVVGMEDRGLSTAERLSFGQMKRVALARLLQHGSRMLILDEPFAGLDETSRQALLVTLLHLKHEEGCSLLIVEHREQRLLDHCDQLWCLNEGRLHAPRTASWSH